MKMQENRNQFYEEIMGNFRKKSPFSEDSGIGRSTMFLNTPPIRTKS